MQAIMYTRYGAPDVLKLSDVATPTPGDDDVLVEVYAAAANAADWHLLRGTPWLVRLQAGLLKPNTSILGADIAGRVAAVGRNVHRLQPGDAVFGDISGCGFGGFAEYVAVPERALVLKPASLTFEQAAAVPMAAVTALQALRDKGQVRSGQKVLINGASGGIGTFAVQIAKAYGAHVTAVCSTQKMELVRSLGADEVIDYTQADFTTSGQRYDLILAANGDRSLAAYARALAPTGTYVVSGGAFAQTLQALLIGPWIALTGSRNIRTLLARPNPQDLACVSELLDAGSVVPVIDRCYPLSAVADAIRYLEAGHARGKVVITVKHASAA